MTIDPDGMHVSGTGDAAATSSAPAVPRGRGAAEARLMRGAAPAGGADAAPASEFESVQLSPTAHLDALRNGRLGGLRDLHGTDLQARLFGISQDEAHVFAATRPTPADHPVAAELRTEYRTLFAETSRDKTRATRDARRLGPGLHFRDDGTALNILTGDETTVQTHAADGSSRTVRLGASGVQVDRAGADGSSEALQRDGTTVARDDTTYRLDGEGRPQRLRPADGGTEETTAFSDGGAEQRVVSPGGGEVERASFPPNADAEPPVDDNAWRLSPLPRYPWQAAATG